MNSIPDFNHSRYYLGSLCKRQHDWNNTGQSLRRIDKGICLDCARISSAKKTALGSSKRKYAKRLAITNQIKLERGCADCGYNAHPSALHFDHLPGTEKRHSIAWMTSSAPLKDLFNEIAKCEVVCANCHAIRTANRHKPWVEKHEKARAGHIADQSTLCKVTEQQVIEIRSLYADGKLSRKELGEMFGISPQNVGHIIRRNTWKHIT